MGMTVVERIPELALDTATEAEIGALLDLCFEGAFGGRSFFLQRHHLRLVTRQAGRITGHLALGLRSIRQGARLIDVVTVAEVAVAPDRRGEGIASGLLAAAIDDARTTPGRFMLLYGEKSLYAGAGFRPAANVQRWLDLKGRRSRAVAEGPVDHLMVLPLGNEPRDEATPIDLLGAVF